MFSATTKKEYKETLRKLLQISSPSGREYPMIEYLKEECEKYCAEVYEDPFGNLVCHYPGQGKKLMLTAHVDELGFIIKSISKDGFLHFVPVGGHVQKQLEARQVTVNGNIPGVIGAKAGHLTPPEEASKITPANEMIIDVGATSDAEVREMGIGIGSYASMRDNYMEMQNPDYICARTLDDRAGIAVMLELMKSLKQEEIVHDLYLVFTLQEEIGRRGAEAAVNNICPDVAIALDTMPCGDYPGHNWQRDLPVQLGKGVGCLFTEGRGTMSFMHPKLMQFILDTAEQNEIAVQLVSVLGISCNTDAANMAIAGKGCHAGGLTIPRRYSHSPVELMHMDDAMRMLALVQKLVVTPYPA